MAALVAQRAITLIIGLSRQVSVRWFKLKSCCMSSEWSNRQMFAKTGSIRSRPCEHPIKTGRDRAIFQHRMLLDFSICPLKKIYFQDWRPPKWFECDFHFATEEAYRCLVRSAPTLYLTTAYPKPRRCLNIVSIILSGSPTTGLTIHTSTSPLLPRPIASNSTGNLAAMRFQLLDYPSLQRIPRIQLPVLTSANHHRVRQPQTRSDAVVFVCVSPVAL